MLDLSLYVALINYNFFLDSVPERWKRVEGIVSKPEACFVRPRIWKDVK
jgi:hypothetical protein